MGKLSGLSPQDVFTHFESLTQIPRESGREQAVSDFLVQFAKKNQLDVIQEECCNVIIKKPATSGYESAPRVILQGHMDMVCVKKDDLVFDFEKDPIPIVVEGDYVKTEGTTLGADNGIAVAMAMAILESKTLEHPEITALFTVAEETGMDGVVELRPEHVEGDILINIDSEEEGTLLSSCAGGVNNVVNLPVTKESVNVSSLYKLSIQGLLGGHSGMEINKNRANAIKLMGRLLDLVVSIDGLRVASITGGDKMNAIAKSAEAIIHIGSGQYDKLKQMVTQMEAILSAEFEVADPELKVMLEPVSHNKDTISVLDEKSTSALISILRLIPFGVQTMSASIPHLVESSNNPGVLRMDGDKITLSSAVRSSVKSLKEEINKRIYEICKLTGASMELIADYPEWPYRIDSPIRDLMNKVYQDMYGKDIQVDAIHAGLECGLLKEKVGDIDMVSLGPNLYDVHTPYERMSIGSVERVYGFLVETLKRIQ